jgi:dTDP-4-amino-4,6-dideoxy-D-glucose acyltransferase
MFLSQEKLFVMGFHHLGQNVQISDKAVFYNPGGISIGDNTRIDDFCLLSGEDIVIGKNVHLACYVSIIGKGRIELADYSSVSFKGSVFSSSDPYDGSLMTNPTIPEPFRQTYHKPVYIGKHVVIGCHSCVFPGVTIGNGSAVGAMSMVSKHIPNGVIAFGVPAVVKGQRSSNIFDLANGLD